MKLEEMIERRIEELAVAEVQTWGPLTTHNIKLVREHLRHKFFEKLMAGFPSGEWWYGVRSLMIEKGEVHPGVKELEIFE